MHRFLAACLICIANVALAQPSPPAPQPVGSSGNVQYNAGGLFGGYALPWVARQDSAGAPVAGGASNAVGDTITLNDGCSTHVQIVVVAVSGGAVTQFMVTNGGSCASFPVNPIAELSSTGSGTGVTVNLNWVLASSDNTFAPTSAASNGQMILGPGSGVGLQFALGQIGFTFQGMGSNANAGDGMGGGSGMAAGENTGVGYYDQTQSVSGNFLTSMGHNTLSHETDGARISAFGTDTCKYCLHVSDFVAEGANAAKYIGNSIQGFALGSQAMVGNIFAPTVSGVANNGGKTQLTVSSSTGINVNDPVYIGNVGGVTGVNTTTTAAVATPKYIDTVDDATHITLQGALFGGSYTSGGIVNDLPTSFSNVAISNAVSHAGLIQVQVANTLNIQTNDVVHIAHVTGTTEANGNWTITVIDGNCQAGGGGGAAGACRVDLVGSTFTNAYISGGQMTDPHGPRASGAIGYIAMGGTALTGGVSSVFCAGTGSCQGVKALANATVLGTNVAPVLLGSTGADVDVILIGNDSTTDIARVNTYHAIGIGSGIKLNRNSVDVGYQTAANETTGSSNAKYGYQAGKASTSGFNLAIFGPQVGSTTLQSGNNVALFGTNSSCDAPAAGTTNYLGLCAGSTPVIAVSGGGTPTSAQTVISGPLFMGATKFTTTGCSISATTGQGTSGTYTSGTTGTCTAVITLNGATGITAPTGWICTAFDRTTPADTQLQTVSSTTGCTIAGTTVSGDVIAFYAVPY